MSDLQTPAIFARWTALPNFGGRLLRLFMLCFLTGVSACSTTAATNGLSHWPQWRGPMANGVAPLANPPVEWSEKTNIRWKIELPGRGQSSPIVFGDRVYVMAAAPVGQAQKPVFDSAPGVHDSVPVTHRFQYIVMAVSRRDGRVL